MDVVFDQSAWTAQPAKEPQRDTCVHPEWQLLRARLYIAAQTWAVLGNARYLRPLRSFGSFSRPAAQSLTRLENGLIVVNQTNSANRKPNRDILAAAAGLSSTGGRGQR